MARLDYQMVAALIWTLTEASANDILKDDLSTEKLSGAMNIDQAFFDVINGVLKSDKQAKDAVMSARMHFYQHVLAAGKATGPWTGTDCRIEEGQINRIAALEGPVRLEEYEGPKGKES